MGRQRYFLNVWKALMKNGFDVLEPVTRIWSCKSRQRISETQKQITHRETKRKRVFDDEDFRHKKHRTLA